MAEDGDEFERDENAEREVADDAEEGAKQAVDFFEMEDENEELEDKEQEKMELDDNTYDEKRDSAQRYVIWAFLISNLSFSDENAVKHADKEEPEDEEIKAEANKVKREIEEKEAENEYVTQTTEKVDLEEKAERDARILDYVARKVAGVEAVMAWREINLSQAAQVRHFHIVSTSFYAEI